MKKTTQDLVKTLDAGLRHKNDMTQDKYVSHYCKLFAKHAYATRDESWNELEKTITHVLGMMIYYKRFCELKGFTGTDGDCFDPRDQVWEIEDLQNEIAERQAKIDLLTNSGILADNKSLKDQLNDQLNDCINFDGQKLTESVMKDSSDLLRLLNKEVN